MSLKLILVRHAKSSWDDPLLTDKDRALNDRGRRAAHAVGKWLAQRGHTPDEVLCSSAVRTQETWDVMQEHLPEPSSLRYVDALYHAPDFALLQQLRKAQGRTVLLIAHNPGIGDFAAHFASAPPADPDFLRYPTAATTVFDVDAAEWKHADFGRNAVIDFITPRSLDT